MATAPRVARSYAKALFELARERNQADAVARELDAVTDLLGREPALRALFARPWISATVKRAIAAEVATRLELSALTRDFIALMAAKGRLEHLGETVGAYRALMDEAAGRVRARVRTAAPLSDGERTALGERLGRALDGKQVMIEDVVDGTLLGGFVAEIGSLLVDGSLDGQLAQMRDRLAKG